MSKSLAKYLKKHKLTQTEFANRIGVTQGAVANWLIRGIPRGKEGARFKEIEKATKKEITVKMLERELMAR